MTASWVSAIRRSRIGARSSAELAAMVHAPPDALNDRPKLSREQLIHVEPTLANGAEANGIRTICGLWRVWLR